MSKQHLEQAQAAIQTQQQSSLQVAVAKLVELPVTELAERVRAEMLDNAALEENDGDDAYREQEDAAAGTSDGGDGYDEDGTAPATDATSDLLADYLTADDVPDYLQARADADGERRGLEAAGGISFFEALRQQAGEHHLSQRQGALVEYLIGSLDDDGFLRKPLEAIADELSFTHGIDVAVQELEEALHVLQQFEPRGIGARDLKECLRLQLTDPERQTPTTKLALAVVDRYFKDFADHHWDLVKQRLNMDDDTFERVRHTLQHLNPRPAAAYEAGVGETAPTVVPDFYVTLDSDGTPRVTLNGGDVPELHVSRAFRESIEQYAEAKGTLSRSQKDAYVYARKKVEAAKSFLNLLERRRVTLLTVMQAIAEMQQDFFKADDDETLLRPMTLREVAERAGVDISTASRVTSSKYVQTVYGTYPLKFFFSQLFTGGDGEELSARQIKARLCELIAAEDKKHPLADEALAALLKQEGFPVARRTVAKYRDAAGLPPARLRKE